MAGLIDRISERATLVGAINIARREADGSWYGDILDGVALVHGSTESGFNPKGQHAFVVGAGGAGCALAVELVLAGASVHVFDVSPACSEALAKRLHEAGHGVAVAAFADPRGAALVVNVTPWHETGRSLAARSSTAISEHVGCGCRYEPVDNGVSESGQGTWLPRAAR